MALDMTILLTIEHVIRCQVCSVVTDHQARITPHLGKPIQFSGDTDALQRGIDNSGQAVPAELIDHIEKSGQFACIMRGPPIPVPSPAG